MDDNDIKLLKKYNSKKKEAERKADFQDEAYHCTLVADIHSKYACRLLGECHCKRGDFDTALRLHERYLELASACNDKVEEQRALTTIGNTRLSRHGAATNKQAKLCEELKTDARIKPSEYSDMKSRLLYNLGLVYIDIEDTETSLTYLNKALQMFQSISQLDMLFQCQRALADLYQTTGRLAEVKKHLASASATAKRDKDRKAEAEAFQAMALVHVQLDEFPQARHLLKKADKVRLPESKRGLASTRETDHSARIPLYEKLADKAVDMGLLKPALKFYQKQLSHSMDAGVGKRELIPIHVSLAQTYADDRKYDKAVVHFQHEIQCRDGSEHEQICRSWLNIAVNQENGGVTNKVIQTSYVNAYNAAKKAGHRKLQVRSLVALSELLKLNGDKKGWEQTETKLSYIRDKYGISESDAEEESQAMEDDDDGGVDEEEVMSDLTDSEEEDEEEEKNVRVVRRPGNRKAHIFVGHPLNPQDNNGWTPLHEACNHGFIDIVQALVESGADMNNRGGQGCNGLTPLMDASSNGHREIMALLIKHGANVIAKDDRGQTALSYFEEYLDSAEERGDVQNLNLLETLREKMPEHRGGSRHADILTQKLTSALIPSSPESNQKRAWRKSGTRKPQGSWRGRVETDSDSDSSIGFSQKRKNVDCLGLLSSDGTRKRNRSSPNSSAKTLDRSGQSSSQKKRIRIEDSDSESSEDEAGTAEQLANVDNGKTDMDVSDDDINVTLTNIDNEIPMMFEDFDDFIIVESQNIPPEPPKTSFPTAGCSTSYSKNKVLSRKNNSSQKQCKLTDYGLVNLGTQEQSSRLHSTQGNYNLIPSTVSQAPVSNSIAVSNISRPGLGNVLRIKVQVEDTVLMIPVVDPDCSRTFAWLAEEVASRYKQMVGVRLKLSLGKEGARFAPTDLLESYLESRDQQPPMADTYREACKVQQCFTRISTTCWAPVMFQAKLSSPIWLSVPPEYSQSSEPYSTIQLFANSSSLDGCALQSLTMCDCNLAMEDVDYLTRLPLFAKHLQKINLSNNPKLTNQMLQDLIQSGCSESSMLEEVVMIDTGIVGPLSVEFIDIIAEKLEAALPLRRLEFSCNRLKKIDTDSLQQIWQDKFEDYAEVSFSNNTVVLSVKDR
ncbi:TONSL-like protein [Mya arenaria]|uniref:TONSL-like protein n=1 Tax=Mya arenaria TaxID=6604 RepID=A0ABY7F041_MYAAR|nr:TONSL-like protein [Mya arenaria]